MTNPSTLQDALDALNPTGERITALGNCRVCQEPTPAGQVLCVDHAFSLVQAALLEAPPPEPPTSCSTCGGDRVVWRFDDPDGRPLREDCPLCVPADRGPGTVPARWHWLMRELERRLPDPEPFRSNRGPEEWYLVQLDDLLARLRRAEGTLQVVAVNAAHVEQAFGEVADKDEYRRGQVRGAKDAARAAVRYLTGVAQPPEDHAEFLAVRARGFEALRVRMALRRRVRLVKEVASWCWTNPPHLDEPWEDYVMRARTSILDEETDA